MIELRPDEFPLVSSLLPAIEQRVLPEAVVTHTTRGWIFVDDLSHPAAMLLGLPCGYFFASGAAPRGAQLEAACQVLLEEFVPRSKAAGNIGFLFNAPDAAWHDLFPAGKGVEIFRRTFGFDARRFELAVETLPPLPGGMRLEEVDADLLARQPGLVGEVLGTWETCEDFLHHGYGAAILHEDVVVSLCIAPFATAQAMEMSVWTVEAQRRKGLGRRAVAAFTRRCLEMGKLPNWECFWDNVASVELAISLGFDAHKDYPLRYWEE